MAQLSRIFIVSNPSVGTYVKRKLEEFIGSVEGIELICHYSEYPQDFREDDILFVEMVPYSSPLINYLRSLSAEQMKRVYGMFSEPPNSFSGLGFSPENIPENQLTYCSCGNEVPLWDQVIEKVQEFLNS